jgi:hypothetical protein
MASALTGAIMNNEDITVAEFLTNSARLGGPLVAYLRDEPLGTPIRQRYVSPYTKGKVCRAEDNLAEAKAITFEEAERIVEREYERDLEHYQERLKESEELKKRYEAMLEKVKAWEPPTPEHIVVKTTAIEQLEESILFDCKSISMFEPKKQDPQEYIAEQVKWARDDLKMAKERLAEEEARVEEINNWIEAFQKSLEGLDEV